MNEPDVFIHIGYGRTATSFLQKEIFPNLENIRYLGKYHDNYPEWLLNWNYIDDFLFDDYIEDIKNNIYQDKQNKIISSEAFTQTGGIYQQIERIKKIVPQPKIILVLRRPTDLVISKYRYLTEKKFIKNDLSELVDFSDRPYDLVRRRRLYLHDYVYIKIINKIVKEFGDKNLLILKYEQLVEDSNNFLNRIYKFTDTRPVYDVSFDILNASDKSINIDNLIITKLEKFYANQFDYDQL